VAFSAALNLGQTASSTREPLPNVSSLATCGAGSRKRKGVLLSLRYSGRRLRAFCRFPCFMKRPELGRAAVRNWAGTRMALPGQYVKAARTPAEGQTAPGRYKKQR
jgi:hypothetical protein